MKGFAEARSAPLPCIADAAVVGQNMGDMKPVPCPLAHRRKKTAPERGCWGHPVAQQRVKSMTTPSGTRLRYSIFMPSP